VAWHRTIFYPYLSAFFALLLAADITGLLINQWLVLHWIAKPLLMPMLMAMMWAGKNQCSATVWRFVFVGLLTAWMGDVWLLWGERPLFFIAGLVSFLTTHVLYIFCFRLYAVQSMISWAKQHPALAGLVLAYAGAMLWLLAPTLGSMFWPVLLYTATISAMLLAAMATQGQIPRSAHYWLVAGALLFVASDSVLAINKFYRSMPWAGTFIMLTYAAAQWMIVQGSLQIKHSK
jgi:uncharacterized membrane protein YhhN